ncbi:unnamed protein product [Musa textilis]
MRVGHHLVHPFTFLYSFPSNSSTAVLLQSLTASFLLSKSGLLLPNHTKPTRQTRAHPTPSPPLYKPHLPPSLHHIKPFPVPSASLSFPNQSFSPFPNSHRYRQWRLVVSSRSSPWP